MNTPALKANESKVQAILDLASELLKLPPIARADRVADLAHEGQFRLSSRIPYVVHPRRVRHRFEEAVCGMEFPNEDEFNLWVYIGACASLLHDVVEDTPITLDHLRQLGFEPKILEAVRLLTHEAGITYIDYLRRLIISGNRLALVVKMCDVDDNLGDLNGLKNPEQIKRLTQKLQFVRFILTDYVYLRDAALEVVKASGETSDYRRVGALQKVIPRLRTLLELE